ncbi:pep a2, partial [Streptomyces sp. SID625]|nr:pep a2 [Streptomyces sp. SID625]
APAPALREGLKPPRELAVAALASVLTGPEAVLEGAR